MAEVEKIRLDGVDYDIRDASAYKKPSTGIPASDLASGVIPDTSTFEVASNKVTSLSSSSTDTQYPSAKAVYDMIGDVETALAALL